ncbi:MAG TPA: GT4 family glycosyltransferase PelF [Bryobacteraceae bacterium]
MERTGIMHVIDGLGSGGAERMVVNLVNALPRDRFRPLLCTSRFDGPLAANLKPDVVWLRLNRRHRVDVSAILRLSRFITEHEVRIVHAHSTSLFLALAVRAINRRIAVVWHDHYGPPAGLRRNRLVYGPAARRADAVITVSETLSEWINRSLDVPSCRIRYIPNFLYRTESSAPVANLPGESGARIVCVARMRPEKDLITLIRSLQIVTRDIPRAHLLLIGPPSDSHYQQALEDEIRCLVLGQNITWLGERCDVQAILPQCDIGVLSSASEGFPVVLLEYGAAHLPVVSTNVGQCAEILNYGKDGRLVPPADPAALAEAITRLLTSERDRRRLGDRLALRVQERYSAEAILSSIDKVYAEVLHEQSAEQLTCANN